MIAKTLFAVLAVVALGVEASFEHDQIRDVHAHKRSVGQINKRIADASGKKVKRCSPKSITTSSKAPVAQSTKPAHSSTHKAAPKPSSTKKAAPPAKTSSAPSKNNGSKNAGNGSGPAGGVINVSSGSCGGPRATKQSTKTGGPNGNIEWLTCGLTGSGWNPPKVTVDELVTADFNVAAHKAPFTACAPYLKEFNSAAAKHGVPAILLASIALQESSCNPNTIGGNGEQGLMQLTQEKCSMGAGAGCRDPSYNIDTGAAYLVSTLNQNGGNILLTIGNYNGWSEGMTTGSVYSMKKYGCAAQQNMDYLQQVLNGFLQGIDPYGMGMGKFFNLQSC